MPGWADLYSVELAAAERYLGAARDLVRAGYPRLAAAAVAGAKEEIDHAHRVSVAAAALLRDAEGTPVAPLKAIEQAEADVLGAYLEAAKGGDDLLRIFAEGVIPEQVAALGEARSDAIRAAADAMQMEAMA